MMMMPDKKNAAGLIVAKLSPEKKVEEKVEESQPQSDYSAAKEDAARKMISALESKDAKMFSAHLQDFMDMCDMEEDASESESEME